MAETLQKRQGRTAQALHLLTVGGIRPLVPGETPFPRGSEEEAGFIAARDTLYKDLLRTILRTDSTSPTYPVGKRKFSIHTPLGIIYVNPGVMSQVGLSTFPHSTTIVIYDQKGNPTASHPFAGNPNIPG